MSAVEPKQNSVWLLMGIVALGAGLRIWGIHFGLPIQSNLYIRPDESLLVQPALHLFELWGDPRFYVYPALVIHMTAVAVESYFRVAGLAGWTEAAGLLEDFAARPSVYFTVPRWISAGFAILTIPLVYRLGLRLIGDRQSALLASVLYALAPLAVRDAHFGVTDNVMVFFLTASLLAGVGYASGDQSPTRAGALFGLAAASKYTAFLLGPRLLAAVLIRDRGRPSRDLLRRLATVTLLPAGIFLVVNPYVIPNWRETLAELFNILRIFYLWQPGDPPWTVSEALMQILRPLRFGPAGLIGLGLAWIGLAALLLKNGAWRSPALIPVGYFVLHLAALIPFRHPVPFRYLLPVLPLVAVFAALGFRELLVTSRRRPVRGLVWALLLVGLGASSWTSIQVDRLLAREDTRNQAGSWIENHVDPEVPVVILCPPEAEPQVYEHADSIIRRTEYVSRRYGAEAGAFISRLYIDQLADPKRSERGWQLHRFPDRDTLDAPLVAVVTCSHPLRMGKTPAGAAEPWTGFEVERAEFRSCPEGMENAVWDWIDALFIPFTRLSEVERPGPNIAVRLLRSEGPEPQFTPTPEETK